MPIDTLTLRPSAAADAPGVNGAIKTSDPMDLWERLSLYATLFLLASLPFKPLAPLARIGGWAVTIQIPLLSAALGFGALSCLKNRSLFRYSWADGLPLLLAAEALISAILSSADRGLCLKETLSLALCIAFYYLAASLFRQRSRRILAYKVLAATAVIVSLSGIWEIFGGEPAHRALSIFKESPTWSANLVRAGGTLHYASDFSMFLEACLPFAYWLLGPAGLGVALLGIFFSLTRMGIAAALAATVLLRFFSRSARLKNGPKIAGLFCAVFCVFFFNRVVLRIPTKNDFSRTDVKPQAGYQILAVTKELRRGETGMVRMRLTNLTDRPWPAGAYVTRHWISLPSERTFVWEHFPLAASVPIQGRIVVAMPTTPPAIAGPYLTRYDIQLPSGRYLSELGVDARTYAVNVPEAGSWQWGESAPDPLRNPSRLALWAAALRMTADHPLLGVGLDGFRQLLERYSGGKIQNKKANTNNIYLHFLAQLGLIGAVLFLALCAGVLYKALRRVRQVGVDDEFAVLAAASAVWFVHGLMDNFLWYFPLALLFWGTLGLLRAYGEGEAGA